jgi:hypothetical protein
VRASNLDFVSEQKSSGLKKQPSKQEEKVWFQSAPLGLGLDF